MGDCFAMKSLDSVDETAALGRRISPILKPGDVLLLEGPLGAGKSLFARSVIQARLGHPEDVPSPTFTLVQTYDTADLEIWHCDLYRLSGPDAAQELGLEDAFETAACLVEWPSRLGDMRPADAITLKLELAEKESARNIAFFGPPSDFRSRLEAVLNA